jgi:hypothetical protein
MAKRHRVETRNRIKNVAFVSPGTPARHGVRQNRTGPARRTARGRLTTGEDAFDNARRFGARGAAERVATRSREGLAMKTIIEPFRI